MSQAVLASGTSTATLVLTACSAGIYLFPLDKADGVLVVNDGEAIPSFHENDSPGERVLVTYLNSGDEVSHYGPAGFVSGVRLGDEL